MLDREGYRPNVGIILVNRKNEVFGASVFGNMPGSSRKAVSNTAKHPYRRCTANCTKKWACCQSISVY